MRRVVFSLLITAAFVPAQGKRTFTGTITDGMCAAGDHSGMRMGPTDAKCAITCVAEHGAAFVLYDGEHVYRLSDQQTPEKFAAKRVTITGTLNAATSTIQVDSIAAAK